MTSCIAMLRGINVSGQRPVKMEQLRESLAALKFSNIQTYLQSGNVVFEVRDGAAAVLSEKIKQRILQDFGFSVPVILRTAEELRKTIKANPFLQAPATDQARLHVTFLVDQPPKTTVKQLQPLATSSERFQIIGREVYLYCPDGYGNTKLSTTAIEKKSGLEATTRNWRTVNALLAMTQ